MRLTERPGTAIAVVSNGQHAASALVITSASVHLRRRLGPLAWMVLHHLALSCRRTEDGWVAAVGVRDIASGTGVTKDTAARAVSTLLRAGLVTRELIDCNAKRRSGYQLHLPAEMWLIDCPGHLDRTDHGASLCPSTDYSRRPWCEPDCPKDKYTEARTRIAKPAEDPAALQRGSGTQPALFDEALARDGEPQSPLYEISDGASHV
jgi:hypothetical protein